MRLIAALSAPTAEGVLYEVDMRLRPSGNKGPVATRLRAFEKYQFEEAWTWEHMALTRARVIAATPGFETEVSEAIRRVLTAKRPSAEEDRYLRESYGNRMLYEYPMLKLWELDADALEESDNPFDWALCAGKRALEGGRDERLKLDYLKGFIDKLDAKGWTHDEKLAIFRLTDTLLHPKSPELRKSYEEFREERRKEGGKDRVVEHSRGKSAGERRENRREERREKG